MLRRPPGHVAPPRPRQRNKYLLALALILLPWLPLADAQQQHPPAGRPPSPLRDPGTPAAYHVRSPSPPEDDQHAAPNLAATTVTADGTAAVHARRTSVSGYVDDEIARSHLRALASRSTYNIPDDVRAHALAPDLSVRAPPPSHYRGSSVPGGAGLSQHLARSLEDWEVEDFVLLATVDGDLIASDRKTGQERWHFKADQPLVETRHFRTNRSVLDEDFDPIDHYIWVVEPTRDGELYLWRPHENGAGLAKMAWTMKKVVEELSPYDDKINGVVYTGDKRTTMITLNALTGTVIKEFGSTGSYVNKVESESCFKPNALADREEECSDDPTITLGRTEYSVIIHRADGSPIASLKYSEWGPNTQDNDLLQQNIISKDSRYITGQHDGKVYGFDYGRFSEERPLFTKTLSSPVARVFDVLRRIGDPPGGNPELIVLPQPPLPVTDEENLRLRSEKVFINQTEQGGWYALSALRYPLIMSAPAAAIHRLDWWKIKGAWDLLSDQQKSSVLVGTHNLPSAIGTVERSESQRLLLDAPRETDKPVAVEPKLPLEPELPPLLPPPQPEPSRIFETAKRIPEIAAIKVIDLISNPAAIVLFFVSLWLVYKDRILAWKHQQWDKRVSALVSKIQVTPTVSEPALVQPQSAHSDAAQASSQQEIAIVPEAGETKAESPFASAPAATQPTTIELPQEPEKTAQPPSQDSGTPDSAVSRTSPSTESAQPAAEGADGAASAEPVKKKKAHRGRRAGVKHRKGPKKNAANNDAAQADPTQQAVEEVVNKAKSLVREPKLEPDIITAGAGDEVSGHILKMGLLEVNEAEPLGTGSNGTIVFAGKWDGRDVAVKRMLVQFNEIASQETRLLRESDDHPNGKHCLLPVVIQQFADDHSYPLLRPARARRLPLHSP